MILASHNSLTYCKPQWYFRPLAWFGRCQDKTIEEQYELGVRYFDIRLRFRETWFETKVISGHGLLSYDINVEEILEYLNSKGDCTVRLTLEISFMDKFLKWVEFSRDAFKCTCNHYSITFTNIIFTGGYEKGSWIKLVEYPWIHIYESYWMFSKKRWFPYPKRYAKRNNDHILSAYDILSAENLELDCTPIMIDFVGIPDKVFK